MHLRIDEPCHENWNLMTPQEKGRHCDKCCKTVFDFTNMPTEEVIQIIASKKSGSVCGKFTEHQVKVPAEKKGYPISWQFKRFFAALVLVFGGALFTGCADEPQGEFISMDSVGKKSGQVIATDNFEAKKDTVPVKTDTVKNDWKGKVTCVKPKYEEGPQEFVGLIAMEPDTEMVPKNTTK